MFVFFSSQKTVLKSWLDTSSIASYLSSFLSLFLIAIPIAPLYLVDQSRMLLPPRQLFDTQWIDRASVLGSDSLLIDTCSIPQLLTTIFSISTSIPLNTCIYQDLLRVYIFSLRDLFLISSISLDLSAPVHLPNTLSFTPSLFLEIFSSLFQDFSSLSKFLNSHYHAFHVLKLRFWVFEKFWSFSKLMSYF